MNKKSYDINFFRRKAKQLLKEYKRNADVINLMPVSNLLENLISDNRKEITLMAAQHAIAKSAGFKKWEELIKASPEKLEQDRLDVEFDDDSVFIETENGFVSGSRDIMEMVIDKFNHQSETDNDDTIAEVRPLKDFSETEQQTILDTQPFDKDLRCMVECLHCGRRFLFEESVVVKAHDYDYIMCKYYPDGCSGSFIDLMEAEE